MIHTSLLGAPLILSPTIWYPSYGAAAAPSSLSPSEDQQVAGLIMWVPGSCTWRPPSYCARLSCDKRTT
jgi:putative membrane protein